MLNFAAAGLDMDTPPLGFEFERVLLELGMLLDCGGGRGESIRSDGFMLTANRAALAMDTPNLGAGRRGALVVVLCGLLARFMRWRGVCTSRGFVSTVNPARLSRDASKRVKHKRTMPNAQADAARMI